MKQQKVQTNKKWHNINKIKKKQLTAICFNLSHTLNAENASEAMSNVDILTYSKNL